ncbi:MAG: polyphosphate kinase 1 [Bacteroidota bacterium]
MDYLIERDVSWLYFNHRVLQEAMDERVPLYERIKFLAIFSSNLDEFVRVRLASLRRFGQMKKAARKELLETVKPKRTLRKVNSILEEQLSQFGQVFYQQILPALEEEGVFLVQSEYYDTEQQTFADQYFREKVAPELTITFIEDEQDKPFLENHKLYFIVDLADTDTFVIVNIPSERLGRFAIMKQTDEELIVTFLDDIIRFKIEEILPDHEVVNCYAIKVSRDAELYLEDEYEGDLVEQIRRRLSKRELGLVSRFLYDATMPDDLLKRVRRFLHLKKGDVIEGARYHNFADFFGFPQPKDRPHLVETALPPLPHPDLETADSITNLIGQQDLMLHFPYQSFDYVPRLIAEAANDDKVESIKITFYRVAKDSSVAKALLQAVKNGKKVSIFIEAKARFDEASNLYWGEKLKEAGAYVTYSFPAIKVHTKLLLISREEEDERLKHYAYIGTGNFNEKTAKIYADHGLLTSDDAMTRDIRQVFYLLDRKLLLPKTSQVMISPFNTRKRFEKLIRREIKNSEAGKEAYMILKMNSLEDEGMIEALVRASQAGVKIQMIVRGICRLVPGVPGYTDNIEITSIVDRFLEHARVYIFANGGEEQMYIASADWMTRNLDRRVEVSVPIQNAAIYQEMRDLIDIQLNDDSKARLIHSDQDNPYVALPHGIHRAQVMTYEYLKTKAEEVL